MNIITNPNEGLIENLYSNIITEFIECYSKRWFSFNESKPHMKHRMNQKFSAYRISISVRVCITHAAAPRYLQTYNQTTKQ